MSDQYSLLDQEDLVRLRSAWDRVFRRLESELPETAVNKFLRPLVPAALDGRTAIVDAPGQFVAAWVKDKYAHLIEAELSAELGVTVRVEFRDRPRERTALDARALETPAYQPAIVEPRPTFHPSDRFRFDNFVIGQSNRLAFAGAKAVAAQPGAKYNPLFVYGTSGLGKTHLMHAIAHEIHRRDPNVHVVYMTGQQFAEEFIHALQTSRIDHFRKLQRGVSVWLLDDVQFIAGKERTQEEFFHTFNWLHGFGKQVVLTSERPPKDLLLMDERLRSRFEAGLVADVQMPDTETRCAIILSKAAQEGIPLDHDVAMFLAQSVFANVRILEGLLTRVAAHASLEGVPVSLALAEEIVEKYYRNVASVKPSFDQILETVSRHLQIPVQEIKGVSRKAPIAHARHVAVYVTREITGDSWKHIGALFGNRDHTSMMHGYKKIRELMNRDKELNASIRHLMSDLFPGV